MGARIVTFVISAAIVISAYFAGAWISATLTHNASHAAPACTGLCPGSGSGGTIGTGTTFTTEGGVGGHTTSR